MLREIKLIDYLPPYIQNYKEIEEIMVTENPEMQLVADETEVIKNNQYILTCDEKGISRFEKLLNILVSKNDSLDARIKRVLVKWNDNIPYTYENLEVFLNSLCGDDGYFMYLFNDEYKLDVYIRLKVKEMYDDVVLLLDRVVPCNLGVNVIIDYNRHKLFKPFMHKELSKFTHRELREKIIEVDLKYLNRHSVYNGVTYGDLEVVTNDKVRRKGEWF